MERTPIVCPDCGLRNPPGTTACLACNYPLSGAPGTGSAGRAFVPQRPRRARQPPPPPITTAMWLGVGVFAVAALLWVALSANVKRAQTRVEGASAEQLKHVEELQAALTSDSSAVDAHVHLANILYDTGNWPEAIVHYRAALRRDSTMVPVLVDLGVSYYNAGAPDSAERFFRQALRQDAHQPTAHFNLGIVYESRKDYSSALNAFHLALQSDPPEELKQAVLQAMQRVQAAAGKPAPPLPQ
jgi:tetratricopeptide (TPR) repeat protein